MGRILFIRVSAATYDERDVEKSWPRLCAAVWPEPWATPATDGVISADALRKGAPARAFMGPPIKGVLELVDALGECIRFGDLPAARKTALEPFGETLADLRRKLDEALGERDVHTAHMLTNSIEDNLDAAEKELR